MSSTFSASAAGRPDSGRRSKQPSSGNASPSWNNGRFLGASVWSEASFRARTFREAVREFGGGLNYFLSAVFNYPTLAEWSKVAALDAFNKLAM
jgi:hypothetical protein